MYAYAKSTTIIAHEGEKVRLYEGEVWSAADPVVKGHPELFADKPTKLRRTVPEAAPVETATAVPGEKRTTRRTRNDDAS
jgi:uncharacterized Fe-S cluster protein YjdI